MARTHGRKHSTSSGSSQGGPTSTSSSASSTSSSTASSPKVNKVTKPTHPHDTRFSRKRPVTLVIGLRGKIIAERELWLDKEQFDDVVRLRRNAEPRPREREETEERECGILSEDPSVFNQW